MLNNAHLTVNSNVLTHKVMKQHCSLTHCMSHAHLTTTTYHTLLTFCWQVLKTKLDTVRKVWNMQQHHTHTLKQHR